MTTHQDAPNWHLNDLLKALHLSQLSDDVQVFGVSIDTRTLKPGDLYIPVIGERDGHDFVADAFAKGACAAIVSNSFDTSSANGICICVPDTLRALQQLGAYNRNQSHAKIIAITGSVGKTTTKEMLGHILSHFGKTVISKASYNNCWGVPLSLLNLTPDTEFGVFEVGMNHPGEIEPLARMIEPHVAIITKIAEAHIGHMGSIEAIALEKSTILNALKPNGHALLYGGGPRDHILLEKTALHNHRLFDMSTIDATVINGSTLINTKIDKTSIRYTLPFSGLHHVGNTILALEACHIFGIDVTKAAKALETFTLPSGRGASHTLTLPNGFSINLIDDAYNANPASMRAGLESLKANKKVSRRIAVLGEMLELGENSATYHRDLLEAVKDADIDLVFCTGAPMRYLYDVLPDSMRGYCAHNADELIEPIMASLNENDLVFVKGSKGSKVSRVVDYLVKVAATCQTSV